MKRLLISLLLFFFPFPILSIFYAYEHMLYNILLRNLQSISRNWEINLKAAIHRKTSKEKIRYRRDENKSGNDNDNNNNKILIDIILKSFFEQIIKSHINLINYCFPFLILLCSSFILPTSILPHLFSVYSVSQCLYFVSMCFFISGSVQVYGVSSRFRAFTSSFQYILKFDWYINFYFIGFLINQSNVEGVSQQKIRNILECYKNQMLLIKFIV